MSLSSTDPKVLMGQAKCFACLSPTEQAQTYLLAKIAGMDTSRAGVIALAAASACFSCLTIFQLKRIKQYLLATWLGVDTSLAGIQALVKSAACVTCLTPVEQQTVQNYLLAVMAGQATDSAGVAAIARAAACFDCLTTKQEFEVQVYILTGLSNASSSAPSDLAAAARCFISCLPYELSETVQSNLITQAAGRLTPPCVTPTAPIASAGAKVITNTTIRVLWNEINTGSLVTSYTVKWGTVSGVYTNSVTVPASPTVYTITGLTPGTQYFWVVVANSFAGCSSANSNEGSATTTGNAPGNHLLNNLISYWKFDTNEGAVYNDDFGTNNLGQISTTTGVQAGIINAGLDTHAGGSFANHADNTDFSPAANTSFAISMWVFATNWTGGAGTTTILCKAPGFAMPAGPYMFYLDSAGGFKIITGMVDSGAVFNSIALVTIPTNSAWHHIVLSFDSPSKTFTGYYDGALKGTNLATTGSLFTNALNFQLGVGAGNAGIPGFVEDEVAIWHRSLTQTDVTNLYNGGAGLPLGSFTP